MVEQEPTLLDIGDLVDDWRGRATEDEIENHLAYQEEEVQAEIAGALADYQESCDATEGTDNTPVPKLTLYSPEQIEASRMKYAGLVDYEALERSRERPVRTLADCTSEGDVKRLTGEDKTTRRHPSEMYRELVETGSVAARPRGPETAADFLVEAGTLMATRGRDRDNPAGERSMARCVRAFNAMTGHNLSETDGWMFMQYLKQARARGGRYQPDDYMDEVAYAALKAESAVKEFG